MRPIEKFYRLLLGIQHNLPHNDMTAVLHDQLEQEITQAENLIEDTWQPGTALPPINVNIELRFFEEPEFVFTELEGGLTFIDTKTIRAVRHDLAESYSPSKLTLYLLDTNTVANLDTSTYKWRRIK
jgi:hypothetical protein